MLDTSLGNKCFTIKTIIMSTNVGNNAQSIMKVIQTTPVTQIAELDFVREKYIQNYNACHKGKAGELMYHRNVIHFKQAISSSPQLAKADPFSLYACFATAAVNGYSLDPQDNEVYLIARGGKACLDRQAGAYIRRLMRTGQIEFAEQAKLVYHGDTFQVENGRVVKHVETFTSDTIVAGYIRMVVGENGTDRFFIYRKSDWESWRKKSSNPNTIQKTGSNGNYLSESLWDNGIIGGTQPEPNFLRTKITKHAAKEKCWATGITPATVETFTDVEVDTEDVQLLPYTPPAVVIPQTTTQQANAATSAQQQQPNPPQDDDFSKQNEQPQGTQFSDDEDGF